MTGEKPQKKQLSEREKRLADALRDNLKRRKKQDRERAETTKENKTT